MKSIRNILSVALGMVGTILGAPQALALNYYELEVYRYMTPAKGELELEASATSTRRGTKIESDEGGNNHGVLRSSLEVSYGLTEKTEVTAYADFINTPGDGSSFGGQRYHARTRFFEKGELPVDLGAYIELEMPKHDEDAKELEFRGIIEKDIGKWTLDFNPILEKVVRGANVSGGWGVQYAASAIYRLNERFHPRLDLFGDFGPARNFLPRDQQKHLLSPAVDVRLDHGFHLLAGVAFGLTPASEQRLIRLKLEREFY